MKAFIGLWNDEWTAVTGRRNAFSRWKGSVDVFIQRWKWNSIILFRRGTQSLFDSQTSNFHLLCAEWSVSAVWRWLRRWWRVVPAIWQIWSAKSDSFLSASSFLPHRSSFQTYWQRRIYLDANNALSVGPLEYYEGTQVCLSEIWINSCRNYVKYQFRDWDKIEIFQRSTRRRESIIN